MILLISNILIFMTVFGIAYILKGGQGDDVFTNWNKVKDRNPVLKFIMSAKTASTIFLLICLSFYTVAFQSNIGIADNAVKSIILIVLAWRLAIAPDPEFTTLLDRKWKEAITDLTVRGVFLSSVMGYSIGYSEMTLYGGLYGVSAYIAFFVLKSWKNNWGWAELFIGALCVGLPFGIAMS